MGDLLGIRRTMKGGVYSKDNWHTMCVTMLAGTEEKARDERKFFLFLEVVP